MQLLMMQPFDWLDTCTKNGILPIRVQFKRLWSGLNSPFAACRLPPTNIVHLFIKLYTLC